jgi:hypothetical protein
MAHALGRPGTMIVLLARRAFDDDDAPAQPIAGARADVAGATTRPPDMPGISPASRAQEIPGVDLEHRAYLGRDSGKFPVVRWGSSAYR